MNYRIEALNSANCEDFFSLFEENQFAHQKDWKSCFCRFYHTDISYGEWMKRTGKDNRDEAKEEIEAGTMNGLLAYEGNLCVGWLNVGNILNYKRLTPALLPEYVNEKTALSICFVIRENYRATGVASALLDQAIITCKTQGFRQLLALPRDSAVRERNYRGFSEMYLNRGYQKFTSKDGEIYMVLPL